MKKITRFGLLVTILLQFFAIASATVSNPYGEIFVNTGQNGDFSVNNQVPSDPNQWTWISGNEEIRWAFYNVPTDTGSIFLSLTPLVTNQAGGGSGYSTIVDVSYETRSGSWETKTVNLNNPQMKYSGNSGGWGYQTYGLLEIPGNKVPIDGQIGVMMKKKQGRTEHIAVKNDCCIVEWHY